MTNTRDSVSVTIEGMRCLESGDLRTADRLFRDAFAMNGRNAQALVGLGVIAHRTSNFPVALDFFSRAIALDSSLAAAHVNRGNSLAALQEHAAAVDAFETALSHSPGMPTALINMATALHAIGRIDEAVDALEYLDSQPHASPELLNNLGNLYKDQGRISAAVLCYRRALDLNPMMQQAFSNMLAAMKLDSELTPQDLFKQHSIWSNWFGAASTHAPVLANSPEPLRRLRIGYVSLDCHTALPAFTDPIISSHSRAQFEVFCYFNNPQHAEKLRELGVVSTTRIMRGMDDQQVAALVHTDEIDILIDIAGHTGHNRLGVFARSPAPVQITWLDYLCTTGLNAMDYRITDVVADPPGSEVFHSESLLRLPHTQWCWQPDEDAPDVRVLPLIQHGRITFGSFNNVQKLTDSTLALWRRLLVAMPSSNLKIAGVPEGRARLRIRDALGCDPSRIFFLARVSVADYRSAFADVDIALDSTPFSGATTTLDALWQGVPVLTLPGARSCSRSTASLLTELELTDWIASDEADFVTRSIRLSSDITSLTSLRASMRDRLRASIILDKGAFTRSLENLYRQAWIGWCEQRLAAVGSSDSIVGTDDALQRARVEIDAGRNASGLIILRSILNCRPHWELAKRELVRACLGWSRANPQAVAAWRMPFARIEPRKIVSAIICSIRPEYFSAIQKKMKALFARHDFEVIGIHDAKSLCEGYNRGAALAKGEILIFCHDDIDMAHDDFGERVLRHLTEHDVIGVVGASKLVNGDWGQAGPPYTHGQIVHRPPGETGNIYLGVGLQKPVVENICALDGVFIATHRYVWESVRFDEESFDGFHLYDIDFSWRAHVEGFRLAVPLDLLLLHFSTGTYNMKWQTFNLRFLQKFPHLSNLPSISRYSSLHVKLQSLEQVERLHTALSHYRFGE